MAFIINYFNNLEFTTALIFASISIVIAFISALFTLSTFWILFVRDRREILDIIPRVHAYMTNPSNHSGREYNIFTPTSIFKKNDNPEVDINYDTQYPGVTIVNRGRESIFIEQVFIKNRKSNMDLHYPNRRISRSGDYPFELKRGENLSIEWLDMPFEKFIKMADSMHVRTSLGKIFTEKIVLSDELQDLYFGK